MGRVLLIIGAVVGGLVLAFGTLGLILAYAQPDANQSDEIVGSIFIMVVGAAVAAPCTFFAYRLGRRSAQPWSPSGSPALATPGADVQQSYLAWFAWCQQALGGDAVSLHAATMAAMAAGAAGNPTAAASAEAARQANRLAALGAMPAAPSAGKVKRLSRIGASTVGLLQPPERVLVSLLGMSQPRSAQLWTFALGVIGSVIGALQMTEVFVTITDRRIIAVSRGVFGGPHQIVLVEPRSTVSATSKKRLFGNLKFSFKGVAGESVSITVPRPWRLEATMALDLLAPPVGQAGSIGIIR